VIFLGGLVQHTAHIQPFFTANNCAGLRLRAENDA